MFYRRKQYVSYEKHMFFEEFYKDYGGEDVNFVFFTKNEKVRINE